jgi:hypothetical protein
VPALDILRRLERTERSEASAARGIADEIVSFEQRRSKLTAMLHSVRTSAAHWPKYGPEPGTSVEAWSEAENARADLLRQVRAMVRQTGTDLGQFNQALALASQPSEADFALAISQAESALNACEAELRELEAERSRRGRRLGELRGSIKQGRDWLVAHGHAEAL